MSPPAGSNGVGPISVRAVTALRPAVPGRLVTVGIDKGAAHFLTSEADGGM